MMNLNYSERLRYVEIIWLHLTSNNWNYIFEQPLLNMHAYYGNRTRIPHKQSWRVVMIIPIHADDHQKNNSFLKIKMTDYMSKAKEKRGLYYDLTLIRGRNQISAICPSSSS